MRKAKATYFAPEGDNPVVEMGGHRFFDGQQVELNTDEHEHLIGNLHTNPHFDVEVGEEQASEPRKARGRPKKNKGDLAQEQKDYAEQEAQMRNAGQRPDGSYMGGPLPGGTAHGVPGIPPLPEGNEGGNVSGTVHSDKKPGAKLEHHKKK
jgi:hypothetical protein